MLPPQSSLIRVGKNFFEIDRKGYQKKQNFALISKMCTEKLIFISKTTIFE
jgi:hypothetical protein